MNSRSDEDQLKHHKYTSAERPIIRTFPDARGVQRGLYKVTARGEPTSFSQHAPRKWRA